MNNPKDFSQLASEESIQKAKAGLQERGLAVFVVNDGFEAFKKIKELIPSGASVMNGTSVTLEQIGYIKYLAEGNHGWNNLKEKMLADKDPVKQKTMRKQNVISDYYLGSVHALCETGEFIVASNSGSQLPHIAYTSPNLIFVVGAQKIVKDLPEGLQRLKEYVVNLEDQHMKDLYGSGTTLSKILVFNKEDPRHQRKLQMIIVKESLGF